MELYQPRTIALACEIFHAPLQPDPRPLQKLHNELFETGAPPYASFAVTPVGAALTNPPTSPQQISQAVFAADRMQFREELGSLTYEDFAQRVQQVAERAAPLRGIQQILAQQVTIRTLINPQHQRDSRRFLRDAMLGFEGRLGGFESEPQLYGLRLAFPAGEGQQGAYNLRIESWAQDPRSLFLEVQGAYGGMIALGALDGVGANIHATYEFLAQRVLPFVRRFDQVSEDI